MKITCFPLILCYLTSSRGFQPIPQAGTRQTTSPYLLGMDMATPTTSSTSSTSDDATQRDKQVDRVISLVLSKFSAIQESAAATEYATSFGLGAPEATLYALFRALAESVPLGLHDGIPLYLPQIVAQEKNLFTMDHLAQAVEDDFLDAARGSTDNRKGWQIMDMSTRGDSFHEARLSYDDITTALGTGTVLMNAAGAHIPRLAGLTLACCDATAWPCALNLYVTAAGQRTSAPPHTDAQDVVVVQTAGAKRWQVFAPVLEEKPQLVFTRGKGSDSLPLYRLKEKGTLLVETTLRAGDVLVIPAGFPHTTSTVMDDAEGESEETSVHLTFGWDHRIWDLDYAAARRLTLRRKGLVVEEPNLMGLSTEIRAKALAAFPLGLVEEEQMVHRVVEQLQELSSHIDPSHQISVDDWRETVMRLRRHGTELLDIHRDMYLAAIEEGEKRKAEDAMRAHLDSSVPREMTPERVQRLSLFRVKRFYDQINAAKESLELWSQPVGTTTESKLLDTNWAFTMPVRVGDQVEADLGGAYFAATVTRVDADGDTYDVAFFDGDRESGLSREQLKLLTPPPTASVGAGTASDPGIDTSNMTAKQLKRWKKQQEKMKKRKLK